MKRVALTVLMLLLLTTSQAPPPPKGTFEDYDSSSVPSSVKESHGATSAGLNYLTNVFHEGVQLLFGKPQGYRSYPEETETNSIATRGITSAVKETGSFIKDVACITGFICKEAGAAFGGLFLGIIGAVGVACEKGYNKVKISQKRKTNKEENLKT